MNTPNNTEKTVQDDLVVTMEYKLEVDGQVYEQSNENGPIQFLQGQGLVVPGLESQLYGMSVGDSKEVSVTAEEGYGIKDPEAVGEVSRSEFPDDIPLEEGIVLQMKDTEGEVTDAVIEGVDSENVHLNFNHPLAGKDLQFSVTVTGIREASEEELAHGHVHEH